MSEFREALRLICIAAEYHVRNDCMTTALALASRIKEAKALLARGEPDTNLLYAAATADWGQVAMNLGPPCFHLDGARFCLRAERWAGHDQNGQIHRFISLAELVGESFEPAAAEKAREQDEEEVLKRMTAAMREADLAFVTGGGGTRHHVRDCLLPILDSNGLRLVLLPYPPAATGEK